jgi:hypothetical protein
MNKLITILFPESIRDFAWLKISNFLN